MFGSGGRNKNDEASKSAAALLLAARDEVCKLLGLSAERVRELLRIAGWDEKLKEPIRQQKIAGKSALAAERIGGAKAVKTASPGTLSYVCHLLRLCQLRKYPWSL
jgi:hypothetical protein